MGELIIDSFAGGGGASLGISLALGRSPDIAVNHNAEAIAMHAANHPETRHYTEDVWRIDPRKVTRGRPVGLLWASPDCRHFSRAKGGTPVKKEIRSLAWVVCRWAAECSPRVIVLENVREFEEWGPLVPRWECRQCKWHGTEGQTTLKRARRRCPRCESLKIRETVEQTPCPDRKGLTFRRFVGRLKNLGYAVEWRPLNASDFGAPTHRRRLFLIARRDGEPIVWPEPTHGDPKKIDNVPLFGDPLKPWRTAAECIDWSIPCPSIFDRKKPLADATLRRIAMGIKRYVIDSPEPFIVHLTHQGIRNANSIGEPLPTVTGANRGELAAVVPFLARLGQTNGNGKYTNAVTEPVTTVTSKAEHIVVAPILAGVGGAEFAGKPRSVDQPKGTNLPNDRTALVTAFLAKHFGGMVGVPVDTPLPTTTARGTQTQIVAANLVHLKNNTVATSLDEPTLTVLSGGTHAALVYSFLVKYFGTAIGQTLDDALHTATGKARFGLVIVHVNGEPYVIVDIGMRMLTPRELARAQGFPDDYILTGTKTSQVHKIGNSVSPPVAKAIVEANLALVSV